MYKRQATYKRITDIIISACGILILLPFLFFLFLVIYFDTARFPLYRQKRSLALGGKIFVIYKLRTIKEEKAHRCTEEFLVKNGSSYTISALGRLLRRTGLDELPQLINVLKGEMSLVGPRPLSIEDLQALSIAEATMHNVRAKLRVKPGITGYWQVYGNRSGGIKNLIDCDTYYSQNINPGMDYKIILKSLIIMFRGSHTDSIQSSNSHISFMGSNVTPVTAER